MSIVLRIAGVEHEIAQVTEEIIYFRERTSVPSGEAVLCATVDGRERRQIVVLPHGLKDGELKADYFLMRVTSI